MLPNFFLFVFVKSVLVCLRTFREELLALSKWLPVGLSKAVSAPKGAKGAQAQAQVQAQSCKPLIRASNPACSCLVPV